jgi:IS30 family transposase
MTTEEKMTIDERWKYLRMMKKRYDRADRAERGRLLDEMEAVTGLHRKSLIRRLHGSLERQPRRRQRGQQYGAAVDDALRVIAETLDHLCAERLTPNLVWVARHLAAHGELVISPALLDQLAQISVSTVQRHLARLRQDEPRLPRPQPRPVPGPTRDVPMQRIPWDEQVPGHLEVDLVHHCGATARGEFVHTLQAIDVATGWSERVALLGRSFRVMEDGLRRILRRLPFPVREVHSDNGSEFFNHHLRRFWRTQYPQVHLSRSRPYQKNDNRFVEQKNHTLVRAYLGDWRLDTVAQTQALNALYVKMGLYYNLFQPVMRLAEKTFLPPTEGQPPRVKRRYDTARTPLDRLFATATLSPEEGQTWQQRRDRLNPRQLRREIYQDLDQLLALPGAIPGQVEDVFQTLWPAQDEA